MTTSRTRVVLVEDEWAARNRLRELVQATPWMIAAGEAATGPDAVREIERLRPDLVLLDIQLPELSGLEVLARLQHRPAVIFTTAYDQHAITAFELGAVDYLLKPFGEDRFTRAIDRARPYLDAQRRVPTADRAPDVLSQSPLRRLFVRANERIVPVEVGAIEHLEADDDAVIVHTAQRTFRLNVSMTELLTRLDPRTFVRVHRSHAVNLGQVHTWSAGAGARMEITLRSGAVVLASRNKSRLLRGLGH
jgi:two-component system LytT family response regulator